MNKPVLAIAVSLLAGIALGAFVNGDDETSERSPSTPSMYTDVYFDVNASTDERLAALERIVAEERDARVILEDQLNLLIHEIERIDESGPAVISDEVAMLISEREDEFTLDTQRSERGDSATQRERRVGQLVAGGFSDDRASWIIDQAAEYQWEAMQAQYEARQNGESVDRWSSELNPVARLRDTLGDMEYEQYLNATGQPSIVSIQSVMATSPASRVGLQPGDEIRTYDGQRIFTMRELQIAANTASSGSDVFVEIIRDGLPMQVSMPAGPLGVTAGGRGSYAPRSRPN